MSYWLIAEKAASKADAELDDIGGLDDILDIELDEEVA